MKGKASISEELRNRIEGEVYDDEYSIGLYSTDASLYQIFPVCICFPKSKKDLILICQIAEKYQVPLLGRGGATSLAGQTVAKAIVIDYSKYLNKILCYNKEEEWIQVEPGITRDELNNYVKKDGLHFAPDPATSDRATIGGMIANNSSGTKSIYYGKTSDHLIQTELLLADGTSLQLSDLSPEEYQLKCEQNDREGKIYAEFRELIYKQSEEITKRFPKVMRRVSGYALDSFVTSDQWNLSQLICGSEGTLGQILNAKIKLTPLPKAKILSVLHFHSREEAVNSVEQIVSHQPSAVEMLDFNILALSKENSICLEYHKHCIQDQPQAVLITEFYGETKEEVEAKLQQCINRLKEKNIGYAHPIFSSEESMEKVWLLRKKGLGLIMGTPKSKKPIPFIEDCAIPLPFLSEYVQQIENICAEQKTEMVIYAHASVGVLHIRPFLDSRNKEDLEKMKIISEKAFALVKQYGGSWSGEHGDGLVRSPRLKDFFGEEIYRSFVQVKELFDPDSLMNPHKIVAPTPMDQNLRYGTSFNEWAWDSTFKFKSEGSFNSVVHNCSGIGACRKREGGTMCPSFKATRDEENSTRGRANALRLALSGQIGKGDFPNARLLQILDLCLSCKACKTECPSNVDMAKLKSEVLQKKYDQGIINFREKLIRDSAKWAGTITGKLAGIVNTIQRSTMFRYSIQSMLGLEPQRTLPLYAGESLVSWSKKRIYANKVGPEVVLFADTYSNYFDVELGKAAVELLESCGYKVIIADAGCCQRPRISNGFLKLAKMEGEKTAINLSKYIQNNIPVLVMEPGCASALESDLPDLIEEEAAKNLKKGVFLIDQFLSQEMKSSKLPGQFKSKYKNIFVHGHCHQKALYGMEGMKNLYDGDADCTAKFLDSGCCGMAGAFGYEKEHYEISRQIGDLVLFPAIEGNPDAITVANGFSCRHQIEHFTDGKAKHWVETVKFEKAEL